jgi:hypothetical protein
MTPTIYQILGALICTYIHNLHCNPLKSEDKHHPFIMASSLDAANLFSVNGLVAVITGGGSGLEHTWPALGFKADIRPRYWPYDG